MINKSGDTKMKYLCCHNDFINSKDGTLDIKDYVDWLHFTEIGYQKFCVPLINFIKNVLLF